MRARGEVTRRAVLQAAERVFAERGYAGARMDDVASAVGIKRASLVYYFRDKRQLYRALTEDLFGGLLERYQAVLTGAGTARERFLGVLDVWSEQVFERPGLLRVLMWELGRVPQVVNASLIEDVAPIFSAITGTIRDGQRDGSFHLIDPVQFMMILAGSTAFLTLGMGALLEGGQPLDVAQLKDQLKGLTERVLFAR